MTPQRVALVTGANKGIGLATARRLEELGFRVLAASRTGAKGWKLDVGNAAEIDAVRERIEADFGRLDVLVNNAGIMVEPGWVMNTSGDLPMAKLRQTMETNFFGAVALTQALLPLLRKAPAARIVNVSSILGSLGLHADSTSNLYDLKTFAYNVSKTALNAFTIHLAHLLRDTPIKVNSAHPGWVKTDMGGEMAPLSIEEGAATPVWLATLGPDGPTGGFFQAEGRETLPW